MTLDNERWNTLNYVRDFLNSLAKDKPLKTSELRKRAWMLLKHYPKPFFLDKVKEKLYGKKEVGLTDEELR